MRKMGVARAQEYLDVAKGAAATAAAEEIYRTGAYHSRHASPRRSRSGSECHGGRGGVSTTLGKGEEGNGWKGWWIGSGVSIVRAGGKGVG